MRVALVHDLLHTLGGAERVLLALTEAFPEAPIFTLVKDSKLDKYFEGKEVHTSYLQKWKWIGTKYLFPLYPLAVESLDLTDYDVVISSSNSYAKNILTGPNTLHVSYIHSPMRYAWDAWHTYIDQQTLIWPGKAFVSNVLHRIRIWDKVGATRVDSFIANSQNVAGRIKKYYGRDSRVIYPPVDTDRITPKGEKDDFFLVISRLSAYKAVDLAIKACNNLDLPLVVIGTGELEDELKKLAGPKTTILGWTDDATKIDHLQHCRGLIFPGEEDFGIVPVEAMAAGRPVIAYRIGGLLETVIENTTGIFFNDPTVESLQGALQKFVEIENTFDADTISAHAQQFSRERFITEIRSYVRERYEQYIDGTIKT